MMAPTRRDHENRDLGAHFLVFVGQKDQNNQAEDTEQPERAEPGRVALGLGVLRATPDEQPEGDQGHNQTEQGKRGLTHADQRPAHDLAQDTETHTDICLGFVFREHLIFPCVSENAKTPENRVGNTRSNSNLGLPPEYRTETEGGDTYIRHNIPTPRFFLQQTRETLLADVSGTCAAAVVHPDPAT